MVSPVLLSFPWFPGQDGTFSVALCSSSLGSCSFWWPALLLLLLSPHVGSQDSGPSVQCIVWLSTFGDLIPSCDLRVTLDQR
jgi:hypothetical protein